MHYVKPGDPVAPAIEERIFDQLAQQFKGGHGIQVRHIGRNLSVHLTKKQPEPRGVREGDVWGFNHNCTARWSHNTNIDLGHPPAQSIMEDAIRFAGNTVWVSRIVAPPPAANAFAEELALIAIDPGTGATDAIYRYDISGNNPDALYFASVNSIVVNDDYIYLAGAGFLQTIVDICGYIMRIDRSTMGMDYCRFQPSWHLDGGDPRPKLLAVTTLIELSDTQLIFSAGPQVDNSWFYMVDQDTGETTDMIPTFNLVQPFQSIPQGNVAIEWFGSDFISAGQQTFLDAGVSSYAFRSSADGSMVWRFPNPIDMAEGIGTQTSRCTNDGTDVFVTTDVFYGVLPSPIGGKFYRLAGSDGALLAESQLMRRDDPDVDDLHGMNSLWWSGSALFGGHTGRVIGSDNPSALAKVSRDGDVLAFWAPGVGERNGFQGAEFHQIDGSSERVFGCGRPMWAKR